MHPTPNKTPPFPVSPSLALLRPHRKPRRKIIKSDSSDTQRELYFPDLFEYKKLDLSPQRKRISRGSWSLQQNKIYLQFLQKNYKDFASQQARRKTVVFNRLSKHLHKRTPDQCRSHHQKLQNRFENKIDEIIHFVEQKIKRKEGKVRMMVFAKLDTDKGKEIALPRTADELEEEDGVVVEFQALAVW